MLTGLMQDGLRHTLITSILIPFALLSTAAQQPELIVRAGHRAMSRTLALSQDNKLLASAGADKTIIIWDLATEEQVFTLTGHAEWVFALAFSPDRKYFGDCQRR